MKRFILKTGKLILIALTVLLLFISGIKVWFMQQSPFKLDSKVNTLVLGHSHIEAAIDDSMLSETVNLAHSADPFLYSYLKFREVLKWNPQLDTVILAFTPTDFRENEERWTLDEAHLASRLGIYSYIMNQEDFQSFMDMAPSLTIRSLMAGVPRRLMDLLRAVPDPKRVRTEFGGYDPKTGAILNQPKELLDRWKEAGSRSGRVMEKERLLLRDHKYLDKIFELVEIHKINLILLNPPKAFDGGYNKLLVDVFDKQVIKYAARYQYFDCSDFKIDLDGFEDPTHLNKKGGHIFSQYIKENGWQGLTKGCSVNL